MSDTRKTVEGILRVESQNDRTGMMKLHKPNAGPYSDTNPKRCVDCGKALGGAVPTDERCDPASDGLEAVPACMEEYARFRGQSAGDECTRQGNPNECTCRHVGAAHFLRIGRCAIAGCTCEAFRRR